MSITDQPKAVWAVAFACVIAFMGIGLVDPILPVLAQDLDATPSQVSLLFTSYFAITGVSMLVTGYVSSRIGPRKTLLGGLVLVIVFCRARGRCRARSPRSSASAPAGASATRSSSPPRSSVIIGSASGGVSGAIILYEAALGLGIASGPLLGGFLGGISLARPVLRHRGADGDRVRGDHGAARGTAQAGAQGRDHRAAARAAATAGC